MLEWLAQYWLTVVFGVLVTGGTFIVKRYLALNKKEQEANQRKHYEQLKQDITNESNASDEKLQGQINEVKDSLDVLTKGILSMQGKQFKEDCRKLLLPEHIITLEEYEQISKDHDAYNGLGGNHEGDRLFNLVQKKFEENITK